MGTKRTITIILCVLLLLAAFHTVAAREKEKETWKVFERDFKSPGLKVVWDEAAGVPRMIVGMKTAKALRAGKRVEKKDVSSKVFGFLERYRGLFRVSADAVKLKKAKRFRNKWYVTLQTYYKGIPIEKGRVGFTLDQYGNILTYASDYNPRMEMDVEPKISKEEAFKIAHGHHKPGVDLPVDVMEARLIIYRVDPEPGKKKYLLAWRVYLGTKPGNLKVDRVFLIDASNGKKIKDYFPDPFTITGTVEGETYPEHSTDAVATVPFEHLDVSIPAQNDTTDASGNYSLNPGAGVYTLTMKLEGPFVRVQSYDTVSNVDQDVVYTASVTDPGTHDRTWTSGNSNPDDGDGLSVFWHANRLHDDYYQGVLGLSWTNNWTASSRMNISVNRGNMNNAFAGNPIKIYSDASARNCDIVYHELTHNVLYNIFGGSYIGWPYGYSEGYAFDEGFADYVACSFNNDSVLGENVITPRDCDNTMQYPGVTYNIEGHTGGQLISGVAWDLWNDQGLNKNDTDVLLFDGLYQMATLPGPYYFSNFNYDNYLTSLLIADDDNLNVSDGTPNDRQIFQAFRNHDLLPVDVFCKDSALDDGSVPSQGNHWTSPDIWVRNLQDGIQAHQNAIYNSTNYIYVNVRNLGYLPASTIDVKVYWADPAGGIPWPADWNFIGQTTVTNLAADSDTVATAIPWIPSGAAIGHRCLLVRLECAEDMMTEDGNVKYENNIAQKNITIIAMPAGPPSRPVRIKFFLHNFKDARMDLAVEAFKVKTGPEAVKRLLKLEPFPFKVELKMPKLRKYQTLSYMTYRKNGGCFFQRLFGKRENLFRLKGNSGEITGIRLKNVDRVLNQIRFIPTRCLKAGEVYEVNLIQKVNGEVVGGLTYIIRIKGE